MPMALIRLTMALSTSLPVESRSSSLSSTKISMKAPADTKSASTTRADMALGSHVEKYLRSSHLDAKKMHQAQAMAAVTCSTLRPRRSTSPVGRARESSMTTATTRAAKAPAAAKSCAEQARGCSLCGSSRPSWFGRTPETAKRSTCTERNDKDSAETSFSASRISSSHRVSLTPRCLATQSRAFSKSSPKHASTAECANTMREAVSGLEAMPWRWCKAHPALMEAKPVMCAQSLPQDCIMLCRLPIMHSGSLRMSAMNMNTTCRKIIQPTMSE
mmetsp:Transcript_34021/g.105731  ORF Transcript_34021/g.105731 Transcript_34021/m.105731 type:complete len:274 (-) Transcript_34021:551-1372(-)